MRSSVRRVAAGGARTSPPLTCSITWRGPRTGVCDIEPVANLGKVLLQALSLEPIRTWAVAQLGLIVELQDARQNEP